MFSIITIPFDQKIKGFDDELLNKFVINKQVKSHRAEFFQNSDASYWTVFLEYDPIISKNSNKETAGLDEPQNILLTRLKVWRKEQAEKDGVPVYIVGTNRELVDIVKNAPMSLEALKNIKGFGKAKISKYGRGIIEILKVFYEKS